MKKEIDELKSLLCAWILKIHVHRIKFLQPGQILFNYIHFLTRTNSEITKYKNFNVCLPLNNNSPVQKTYTKEAITSLRLLNLFIALY